MIKTYLRMIYQVRAILQKSEKARGDDYTLILKVMQRYDVPVVEHYRDTTKEFLKKLERLCRSYEDRIPELKGVDCSGGMVLLPLEDFFKLPPFESITRARRKCQEQDEKLKPSQSIQDRRFDNEYCMRKENQEEL